MNDDVRKIAVQTVIGLTALLNMLEEKGILTEEEYEKYYEKAKKVVLNETFEKIKNEIF